jgi:hypothetical protein
MGPRLAFVVLMAVLLAPATAGAAPLESGLRALSDAAPLSTAAEFTTTLDRQRAQLCAFTHGPTTVPSLSSALAAARRFVAAHSKGSARHKLDNSSFGRHEHRAEAFASAALLDQRPQAALEALLDAHHSAPHDPLPLVDAAPILTEAGLPRDALAFVAAASSLKAERHPPLGIDVKALALNNKGDALLALGRFKQAGKALRQALHRAPLLTEADINLAAADLCAGKPKSAGTFLAAGGRRQNFDEVQDAGTPPSQRENPPASEVFDLSQGISGAQLPDLPYPSDPTQAPSYYDFYFNDQSPKFQNETQAIAAEGNQLGNQRRAHPLNALTDRRTIQIMGAISNAEADPALKPLADAYYTARAQVDQFNANYDPYVSCYATSRHTQYKGLQQQLSQAVRDFYTAWYRHVTGLEANLKDPISHAIAANAIRHSANAYFGNDLLERAEQWVFYEFGERNTCYTPAATSPQDPAALSTPPAAKCPEKLMEVVNFAASFIPGADVSFDCEKVTIEVSTEGVLGAFGRATLNRKGEVTIFGGPKASVSVRGLGSATFQDGIYVRFDSSGNVSDVGGRVEHSESGLITAGDSMDFSIAGVNPVAAVLGP